MEREISGSYAPDLEISRENITENELDLPPEFCHFRDEGCEVAPSCLDCPQPRCVLDEPGGRRHRQKEERDAEIMRQFASEARNVKELARLFKVSVRTVERVLKRSAANKNKLKNTEKGDAEHE